MPLWLLLTDIPRDNSWHEFRVVRVAMMTDLTPAPAPPQASPNGSPPKLLDQVRQAIRLRHYSRRTESAYVAWIRRFIVFHHKRHPRELGERDVTAFLSNLAARGVSASTQNQALSAILFLYGVVLGQQLAWMNEIVRAQRPARLPVVLSRDEVSSLLSRLRGPVWLMASLMYGAGLRLLECVELRVKDLNFDRGELTIRDGKGGKDRVTMLPASMKGPLAEHLHARESAARRGLGGWPRWRRPARFTPGQVPQRAVRMGVAMGVSRDAFLLRPRVRRAAPTSLARVCPPARRQGRRARRRDFASSHATLTSPFVRDSSS